MAKYFTLLTRQSATEAWSIHFGDYDREVVADEQADVKDSDETIKTKIISSKDDQASINAAFAKANASVGVAQ